MLVNTYELPRFPPGLSGCLETKTRIPKLGFRDLFSGLKYLKSLEQRTRMVELLAFCAYHSFGFSALAKLVGI